MCVDIQTIENSIIINRLLSYLAEGVPCQKIRNISILKAQTYGPDYGLAGAFLLAYRK
jgi:hypothetical protein